MSLIEFLKARLDEDEAAAQWAYGDHNDAVAEWTEAWTGAVQIGPTEDLILCNDAAVSRHIERHDPARVLAEIAAKRQILELHESWPVLVETQPELSVESADFGGMAAKVSQRIAWLTTQEYRERFGDEPPTSPVLRSLALPYAGHPDYDESWRP